MKPIAIVALLGALAGCSRKKPEEGLEPPPAMPPVGSAGSAGSAEAPKPVTGEALAKRLDECWGFWNAAKYDDFKGCLAADATSEAPGLGMPPANGPDAVVTHVKLLRAGLPDLAGEPVLELVNDHHVATIVMLRGTHTATLEGPMGKLEPTNKKAGILLGQAIDVDDTGHSKHEADYFDLQTLIGQLGAPKKDHPVRPALDKAPMPKAVVIAKNDAAEKANVEVAKQAMDAFGKHDAKAFGATLADGFVWSEQAQSADWTKKQTLEHAQAAWKTFKDLKMTPASTWAAGDYVVTTGTMDGTDDQKQQVSLPFLAIQKIAGGKIETAWVFGQSPPAPAPAAPAKAAAPAPAAPPSAPAPAPAAPPNAPAPAPTPAPAKP